MYEVSIVYKEHFTTLCYQIRSEQGQFAFTYFKNKLQYDTHLSWSTNKPHIVPHLKLLPKGQMKNSVRHKTPIVGHETFV